MNKIIVIISFLASVLGLYQAYRNYIGTKKLEKKLLELEKNVNSSISRIIRVI